MRIRCVFVIFLFLFLFSLALVFYIFKQAGIIFLWKCALRSKYWFSASPLTPSVCFLIYLTFFSFCGKNPLFIIFAKHPFENVLNSYLRLNNDFAFFAKAFSVFIFLQRRPFPIYGNTIIAECKWVGVCECMGTNAW